MNGSGSVAVPAAIRRAANIASGDKLRWRVEEGHLSVDVVKQREEVFEDFEPLSMGGNVVEEHDLTGTE